MDPITAMAIYGGGSAISAIGSYLGGQSQGDAIRKANEQNAALTRESWARDDTAVQRRTADLIKAGLNPALAAGSAATTSSPLPMQSEGSSGVGDAMKLAGQAVAGAPTVEQSLKRNAAATVQSEAQAELTDQQARIARMDADNIAAGKDPRNKGMISELVNELPKLAKAMKGWTDPVSNFVNGDPARIRQADADASEAIRLMRNPTQENVRRARMLNERADRARQGGYR